MVKMYTLFQTKTAQKPYPLGPHIPIRLIQGSTPPGSSNTPNTKQDRYYSRAFLVHEKVIENRRKPENNGLILLNSQGD